MDSEHLLILAGGAVTALTAAGLLVAVPATAHGAQDVPRAQQARTPETVLMSENERGRADQERFGFSDAVIAGDLILLSDIVDITSYHTDIEAEIGALSEASKRFLGSPPPAWTAIDVDRLLPPNGVTEIKIVARRSAAAAAQ